MKKLLLFVFLWPCALLAQGQIFPARTLYGSGPVTVYPEGFVAAPGQELTLNGEREYTLDGSVTVSVEDRSGTSAQVTLDAVITPASALPEKACALVLCMGESTCDLINANPYTGSYAQGWNWSSMLRYQALQDGVDIRCLGTATLPEGGVDACYTGHGGWSAYTFLNWPVAAKMDPWAPDFFLKSEAMWAALGLEQVTGKAYEGSAWQHDLIARTRYGTYRPAKKAPHMPKEPVNEFFTPEEGFSLDTYLARYRTLDDAGEPLPAVGANPAGEQVWGSDGKRYTVGSRITSQVLLRRIQVCRPTQVVLNLGINDGDSGCSVEVAAEGIVRLMDAFGSIPVAWFVNRWPGVCRKELWKGEYVPRQYGMNGNNTRVEAIIEAVSRRLEGRKDRYVLDVWHTQFPASQHEEKLLPDGRLDCSVNDVHLGYRGQWTAARQVQGWLYWLLARQPRTALRPNETVYLYAGARETGADRDLVSAPAKTLAGFKMQYANGAFGEEVLPENGNLSNVSRLARVDLYFPEGGARKMVVVCPGGAYLFVSSYNEGVYTASWLVEQGYAAAVVKYRLPLGHHEVPLEDVRNVFRYCRAHAQEWGVESLGIMGFSAGGHLAASASTLFVDDLTRPDFSVLIYPVISLDPAITHLKSRQSLLGPRTDLQDHYSLEKQVSGQTPPTFLALSADDKNVSPENSIRYFQALQAHQVPAQMYVYPNGGHGWGFTTDRFGRDGIAPCREEFFTSLNRFLSSQ